MVSAAYRDFRDGPFQVTIIQGILIAGFTIARAFASRIFRTKVLYRQVPLALFPAAPILIIFPVFTTVIARALGAGRGRGSDRAIAFSNPRKIDHTRPNDGLEEDHVVIRL